MAMALAPLCGAALLAAGVNGASAGTGDDGGRWFIPGNLVVSRSVYTGTPGLLQSGVTVLPPGCTSGCATAISDGSYPQVWNNDLVDGSFGITSAASASASSATSPTRSARTPTSAASRSSTKSST
jgi:hypothetical protein